MDAIKTNKEQEKSGEMHQVIDYKMVTFSLGGKDYGIDIMKVKEISKVEKYTYVPNTYPYVLGVHNLRGDIISIIDMRKMFDLQGSKKDKQKILNVIIIRLDEFQLGIVVDSINKVVGISSETIQPPPSLFSDINIKYLDGVVEYGDNLFLILDVDKIFQADQKLEYLEQKTKIAHVKKQIEESAEAAPEFNFIVETLATFKNFFVTELNRGWIEQRFKEWRGLRKAQNLDLQLKGDSDADAFLNGFYSRDTGKLWSDEFAEIFRSQLPDDLGGTINVWNSGCGRGYETYSLALILREQFPKEIIKVWANDNDLLSVSTAPSLVFKEIELPEYAKQSELLEKGKNGYQFKKDLKDLIYFEFHDTLHTSAMPDIDIIIARDVISFQTPANQKLIIAEFDDKLKAGGLLVIGEHEDLLDERWSELGVDGLNVYRKEK